MAAHLVNNREPSMDGDSPGFVPCVFPHSAPDPTAKAATRNERSSRRQEEAAVSSSTLHTDADAEAASDVKQLLLVKVEAPEEMSCCIKEEPEEVWIGQEEKQLCVKEESSAASFPVSTTSIKSEDDAETPLFSQLHKHQKDDDCPTSRSTHQLSGIISEEDFGGAESTWNPSLNTHVEICNSTKTEVCEDDEESRNVNYPNFEVKRLSDSYMKGSECESRVSVSKGDNVSNSLFSLKRHKTQGCSSGLFGKKCFKVKKTADSQNTVQTIPTSFTCDDCGKTFNSKRNINEHKRNHTRDKPFPCDLCRKNFISKSKLVQHMRIHTGEKPFRCDVCAHSFSQKSNLRIHMRIHIGEKPFRCDVCGNSFRQKTNLDQHRRIHTGEKPFRCYLCGHSFSSKSVLDRHTRIHTGAKPFRCNLCGHNFSLKSNLNQHRKIHTGEKPFCCDFCGHSFNQKANLERHKVIHTRQR